MFQISLSVPWRALLRKMWKQGGVYTLLLLSLVMLLCCYADDKDDETRDPHRNPSLCEVCKYLTTEVKGRLDETGKTREVLETGYGLDQKKKRREYKKSELRLIEVINDPHVCDKILEYNIHAERKGSLRFAKGRSQTMETLHGLVHKGVKVELGIPYEMWDTPSAGVTEMQRQCFKIVEDYEEDIEDWYWNHQDKDFTNFLCRDRMLRHDDQKCLSEEWSGEEKDKKEEEKEDDDDDDEKRKKKKDKKKKVKGDTGNKKAKKGKKKDESKLKGDNGTVDSVVEKKDAGTMEPDVEKKDAGTMEPDVEKKDEL